MMNLVQTQVMLDMYLNMHTVHIQMCIQVEEIKNSNDLVCQQHNFEEMLNFNKEISFKDYVITIYMHT